MFPLRCISAKKSILRRELPNNKDNSNRPLADSTKINSNPHLILATFQFLNFYLREGHYKIVIFSKYGTIGDIFSNQFCNSKNFNNQKSVF